MSSSGTRCPIVCEVCERIPVVRSSITTLLSKSTVCWFVWKTFQFFTMSHQQVVSMLVMSSLSRLLFATTTNSKPTPAFNSNIFLIRAKQLSQRLIRAHVVKAIVLSCVISGLWRHRLSASLLSTCALSKPARSLCRVTSKIFLDWTLR